MHIQVNGASLFCVDKGDRKGLPVVFVHGFPLSHSMWNPQLDLVAKGHRAIAYDLRGHGHSSVGDGQYTIEGHVDDLIGLMDQLEVKRAVLVGLSMGGYIALRAIEREPGRFLALALCDTRSEADTNEGRLKRAAGAAAVKQNGSAAFAEGFLPAVFAPQSLQEKPEIVAQIHDVILNITPLSLAGHQIAMAARTDTTPSLASIAVPTLVMVGELDTVTPPADSSSMQEKIPGAELHVIPGAGHMSNMENPDFFNEKLMAFLERVASTQP